MIIICLGKNCGSNLEENVVVIIFYHCRKCDGDNIFCRKCGDDIFSAESVVVESCHDFFLSKLYLLWGLLS